MLLGEAYLSYLFIPKIIILPKLNILINIGYKMIASSVVIKENKGKLKLNSAMRYQRTSPNALPWEAYDYF